MLSKPKNKKLAILLALSGVVLPISGFHKFYLGQPGWGVAYLLLSMTPVPRIASAIEALWYLAQGQQEFDLNFNNGVASTQVPVDPSQVGAIAESLRQLDQLRQDGLLSEYEFEQKRRTLLDQIG
jgi:TM2 domain-containing membrane protein YozV